MKIAISVSEKEKTKGQDSPYFKALLVVGVKPDELELVTMADSSRVKAADFDGILLAGGEDVDPSFYDEEKRYPSVHANRARDEFEFSLLDRALDRRLPILGICRGIQTINVKFRGTLYQDLENDKGLERHHKQTEPRPQPTHSVTVTDPDSHLAQAIRGSCQVNSLHHQAIKRLAHGLKATAYSDDGLYEALEAAEDYPHLVAVQWHPEEMVDHPEQRKIFEQFVAKCREAAARRK